MKAMYLATTLLVACTVEAPDTNVTESHVEVHNRLAGNRLAGNRLSANRLAGNRLAGNALSTTSFQALPDTADILKTEDGREVYYYIVSCALPDYVTIEADVPDLTADTAVDSPYECKLATHHCTFKGNVGVAPRWQDHKLDTKGQSWVSACLFSRVNRHGLTKDISMRGRNDGLSVTDYETNTFTVQEGAFFGNIFDNPDVPVEDIDWHACSGTGVVQASAAERDCAVENVNGYTEAGVYFPPEPGRTICGFKYAGPCGNLDANGDVLDQAYSCELYNPDTKYFGNCHDDPKKGHWSASKRNREVITTYLTN